MAGRIFVTGDCLSNFIKFSVSSFPEQKKLDKNRTVEGTEDEVGTVGRMRNKVS